MYIKRAVSPKIVWFFSWRTVCFTALWSTAVCVVYFSGVREMAIPFLPIATIGTAVAFYIGFKNNAAYDRLWEARKVWGELVNSSRSLSAYVLAVLDRETARKIIFRQLAYVNMIRLQLRRGSVWDERHIYNQLVRACALSRGYEEDSEETFARFCDQKSKSARMAINPARALLTMQFEDLKELKNNKDIDEYECSDLMRICSDMFNHQGKVERIKSFPFPRQYANFSEIFVQIFMVLIPFGLIGEFAKFGAREIWLTVPFTVLISWIFYTMEKVGDTSENPFENGINDVPMTAICRNLEIDLFDMLGETDLPQPIQPVHNILM